MLGGIFMRLVIADDDALIRDSLSMIFSLEPDIEVSGCAADGNQAIELCRKHRPDMVLMDIRMPGCDGVMATRVIKSEMPQTRVVLLTTFTDEEYIMSALKMGAEGYLLKSTPAAVIVERIRTAVKGAAVYDSEVMTRIAESLPSEKSSDWNTPVKTIQELTERENEVLYFIAGGHSNREISAYCHLSEGSVRNIISVILEKLGLRDRTQLAVFYWRK